jgi:hypothetical protein
MLVAAAVALVLLAVLEAQGLTQAVMAVLAQVLALVEVL